MAIPAGYKPIGPKYSARERSRAIKEAKWSKKHYGDSYIVRPIKAGKTIVGYQIYWKRGR